MFGTSCALAETSGSASPRQGAASPSSVLRHSSMFTEGSHWTELYYRCTDELLKDADDAWSRQRVVTITCVGGCA